MRVDGEEYPIPAPPWTPELIEAALNRWYERIIGKPEPLRLRWPAKLAGARAALVAYDEAARIRQLQVHDDVERMLTGALPKVLDTIPQPGVLRRSVVAKQLLGVVLVSTLPMPWQERPEIYRVQSGRSQMTARQFRRFRKKQRQQGAAR